jgi:hypothetical protein
LGEKARAREEVFHVLLCRGQVLGALVGWLVKSVVAAAMLRAPGVKLRSE